MDEELIKLAKEFLEAVSSELDPYTSTKGEVVVGDGKVSLLTPSHIQFAKYGRGPGKKPPLDPILAWVKKNRVQFPDTSKEGTAFAIQASIGKKGTSNWVPNAPNALEEAVQKNIEEYNRKVNETITVEVRDVLNKTYKKLFPKESEFKT